MLHKKIVQTTIVLLLLIDFAIAQQNEITVSYCNKIIKKEGKQIEFEVKEKVVSKKKKYSGKKTYYWYKSQTIISTKGAASGHLLNGSYKVFYDNQQFAEKGTFINGLKHGKWIFWDPNGEILRTENWFFGKSLKTNKSSKNVVEE